VAIIAAKDNGSMISLNNFHRLRDKLLSQLKLNLKINIFAGGQHKSRVQIFSLTPLAKLNEKQHTTCKIQAYLTDRSLSYSLWCSVVTGNRGMR